VKMVLVFELISDKDNVTEICTGKYHAQAWSPNCVNINLQFLLASWYRRKHLKKSRRKFILSSLYSEKNYFLLES
jgi:hypothetical protein